MKCGECICCETLNEKWGKCRLKELPPLPKDQPCYFEWQIAECEEKLKERDGG